MKAIVYSGPRDVSVKNVPDAKIREADRRSDQSDFHQYLWFGPAHVRRSDLVRNRAYLWP